MKLIHQAITLVAAANLIVSASAMDAKDYKKFGKKFREDVNYENFSDEDLRDVGEVLDEEIESSDLVAKKKRVKFEEIKSWQWLGDRYALGFGEEGDALAVYDLSWPQVFSFSHFPRTLLGSIGIGDLNVSKLIEVIRGALNRKSDDNFLGSDRGNKIERTLNALDQDFGDLKNEMPDGWWKKAQWKNSLIAQSAEAPERFFASDMDLALMSGRPDKFAQVEAKTVERLNEFLELNIKRSFFDHFEFVKREDGKGYDLYFVVPERDYVSQDLSLRPKKIADLRNPKKSFLKSFGLIAVEQGLKQLIGFLPVPVVANILDVAVGKWFNLMEQQEEAHHAYTLELLDQSLAGVQNSPLSLLDEETLYRVGEYLVGQQASWFKIIFNARGDQYDNYVEKRNDNSKESLDWLSSHDYQVTSLTDWFALGEKDGKKRLFLLNEQYRLTKHPLTGMDYSRPEFEIVWRHLVEAGSLAIDLIPIPVAFASSALDMIYNYFLEDPIENAQEQEARFRAWTTLQTEGDWSAESQHMLERRLNPFELNPEAEAELIARRRANLGI